MFGNYAARIGIIGQVGITAFNKNAVVREFWDFNENPSQKELVNFSIDFTNISTGIVLANWNDNTPSTIMLPNTNYSHTFN